MASLYQTAEVPVGVRGLNGNRNQSQIPLDALTIAENITLDAGTIQKEGGTASYTTSGVGADGATPSDVSVIAGYDWDHDGSSQAQIVVTSDGSYLKEATSGAFTTTLSSGLTVSGEFPVFAEGGKEAAANSRKLFMFSGLNTVRVNVGSTSTASNLGTPPADWSGANQPRFGVNHEGRMWAGGNSNDPNRLYWSTVSDHENWTGRGSGSISVYPGEAEKLVGAVSYRGALVCFKKPRGIYLIDTSSPFVGAWTVDQVARNIGVAGVRAYTQVENDVLFVDNNGDIRNLSAVQEFGDVGTKSISDLSSLNDWLRNNLALENVHRWTAVYYPTKRQVHIAATESTTLNNFRIVIDLNKPGVFNFSISNFPVCEALWTTDFAGTLNLMAGDDDGKVWQLDQTARSHNGAGYQARFKTPDIDFSHVDGRLASIRKQGKYLELLLDRFGVGGDLTADIFWDGEFHSSVTFSIPSAGSALGTFVLGTDVLGGQDAPLILKRRITGGGKKFSIQLRNSANAETFSLARYILHFTAATDRPGTNTA